MSRAAAFFDLDGTLLTVNSADLWIRRERRLGRITHRQLARAALYLGGYRLGVLNMENALRAALGVIRGQEESPMRSETIAWWHEEVRRHAAPGARPVLQRHRQAGEKLVLLTSSSRYAAELAREEFGLDDVLYQGYGVAEGRFTGEPLQPICYGPGKVLAAEAWAAEHDVDLAQSAFYSDSFTDLPMLTRVGRPHAVAPDLRLSRHARLQGWPILDWSH